MTFQVLCVEYPNSRSVPMDELDDAKEWAMNCNVPFEVVNLETGEVVWDEEQMELEAASF